jgi:MraZ protein
LDQFLSTFTNKIDRKGRVSVPADYRAVLARRNSPRLVLYPAVHYQAVEGAGEDYLAELDRRIESLPPLSEERDNLVFAIKPAIRHLAFDSEGRVMLSDDLIQHAGLGETAVFVGLGANFQIWTPERWAEQSRQALEKVRAARSRPGAPR